jgi:hypothetical protein
LRIGLLNPQLPSFSRIFTLPQSLLPQLNSIFR